MKQLYLKLALMFVGAPMALLAEPLGRPWLFYSGLALLMVGLILPSRADETLKDKLRNLFRHIPGGRWLSR